jgi:hypothetical protein
MLFPLALSNPFTTPLHMSVEVVFPSKDLVWCSASWYGTLIRLVTAVEPLVYISFVTL